MDSITSFNKGILLKYIDAASTVVDATLGNGHDTLFLAEHAKEVHAFDVQESALNKAKKLLDDHGVTNVIFHGMSHHRMDEVISKKVRVVMFNFGYLPGGDPTKTTKTHSSLIALEKALDRLEKGGVVTLALYPGHKEGKKEAKALEAYVSTLEMTRYQAIAYKPLNAIESPYSIIIEKRKD